ncbi:MAG: acyl-CoA dehydratase activase-related protein [Firmicutes bacterium]|nr:acyl-CoA dehydratase activase-related protein [Bacillota bacterium]
MKPSHNPLKIGIPNTLFAAYHLFFWRRFMTLAGIEAVISGESAPEMADRGGRLLPHEFCVPIKMVTGHIIRLLEMGVDQILLPRMLDCRKNNYFCPKLIGLPEIVKYTLNLDGRMLFSPTVICNGLTPRVIEHPPLDGVPRRRIRMAEQYARQGLSQILDHCRQYQVTLPEAMAKTMTRRPENRLTIGLLGYAYSLYDPFISKGILSKLRNLGAALVTWEMLEPHLIEGPLAKLKRPLFWNFGRLLLGAGLHFLSDSSVDGIVYVTAFGCGPDAVVSEILKLEAGNRQKPFLLINLDEHAEDGHLSTRLEAYAGLLTALKEETAG